MLQISLVTYIYWSDNLNLSLAINWYNTSDITRDMKSSELYEKPFSLKEVIFTIIKQLDKWNQTKITFIHFNLYSSLWCRSVDTGWKLTSDIKFVQLGFNPAILNTSKIDFSGIPTKCLILLRRSSWIAAITFPSFTNTAPLSWPSFIPRTMCYF